MIYVNNVILLYWQVNTWGCFVFEQMINFPCLFGVNLLANNLQFIRKAMTMHIISYSLLLPLFDYFPAITCNMKPSIMRYRICKYLTLQEKLETGPFSKEVGNKRIIVNHVLSFSWKHQLHLQIPETQVCQWNRNNSFQRNLITSNSWNLFTTVIWNINYDNVLTSFVTQFSKAWQFSFWSCCNICFVTCRISLPFFLLFVFYIYPWGKFLFLLCFLPVFLTFPIIPPFPGC